eukprot:scaffold5130_cov28-Tisochrysis_lutea.AAC.3
MGIGHRVLSWPLVIDRQTYGQSRFASPYHPPSFDRVAKNELSAKCLYDTIRDLSHACAQQLEYGATSNIVQWHAIVLACMWLCGSTTRHRSALDSFMPVEWIGWRGHSLKMNGSEVVEMSRIAVSEERLAGGGTAPPPAARRPVARWPFAQKGLLPCFPN